MKGTTTFCFRPVRPGSAISTSTWPARRWIACRPLSPLTGESVSAKTEWSVAFDLVWPQLAGPPLDQELAADLVGELGDHAAVCSFGAENCTLRLSFEANSAAKAVAGAEKLIRSVVRQS